jgi:hypothetical protein
MLAGTEVKTAFGTALRVRGKRVNLRRNEYSNAQITGNNPNRFPDLTAGGIFPVTCASLY